MVAIEDVQGSRGEMNRGLRESGIYEHRIPVTLVGRGARKRREQGETRGAIKKREIGATVMTGAHCSLDIIMNLGVVKFVRHVRGK